MDVCANAARLDDGVLGVGKVWWATRRLVVSQPSVRNGLVWGCILSFDKLATDHQYSDAY